MNYEELRKIAEEYVDSYAPSDMEEEIREGLVQSAILHYQYLNEHYCIIDRSTLKNSYERNNREMKDRLSIEQSAKLVQCGINARKAHLFSLDDNGTEYPIFSLDDILAITPKRIRYKEYRPCVLYLEIGIDSRTGQWRVQYMSEHNIDEANSYHSAYELIDALYQLLVYCINRDLITP